MRKLATMVLVFVLALGLPLATNAKGKQSKSKPAHKSQRAPDEHKAFEQQKKRLHQRQKTERKGLKRRFKQEDRTLKAHQKQSRELARRSGGVRNRKSASCGTINAASATRCASHRNQRNSRNARNPRNELRFSRMFLDSRESFWIPSFDSLDSFLFLGLRGNR